MYKVIGIDEAGKGPVIGSMFIGFSIIYLANGLKDLNNYQTHLKELGVKDSKKLTPKKRNEIYQKLKQEMDIKYVQLTPALIDTNYFSGGTLHELELSGIVQILESEKPNLVIIDALTSKPEAFGEEILKRLSFECKIISENKADSKYEIVGAASIIAKELREQELREINNNVANILSLPSPSPESPHSITGSGYPSDGKTRAFLEQHWNNKEFEFIFRKSWATYSNVSGEKGQLRVERKDPKQKTLDGY
jgi:ribonuclease HII